MFERPACAAAPATAHVTRVVIDEARPFVEPPGSSAGAMTDEQIAGRAFGELDPEHSGNSIIQNERHAIVYGVNVPVLEPRLHALLLAGLGALRMRLRRSCRMRSAC